MGTEAAKELAQRLANEPNVALATFEDPDKSGLRCLRQP